MFQVYDLFVGNNFIEECNQNLFILIPAKYVFEAKVIEQIYKLDIMLYIVHPGLPKELHFPVSLSVFHNFLFCGKFAVGQKILFPLQSFLVINMYPANLWILQLFWKE